MTRIADPFRRRGFTLTETLAASFATGVLLVAMGSAIALSSRAIPAPDHAGQGQIVAAQAMERIHDDLANALFLPERGGAAVTLIVPDRTGDGASERIRYAWSGDPGDPLTRQVNDGEPRVLMEHVGQFELAYDTATQRFEHPAPLIEDSDETLISGTGSLLDLLDQQITGTNWLGEYIVPSFSEDVVSWRPTRMSFHGRRGSSALFHVEVVQADDSRHATSTSFAHGTISSNNFSSLLLAERTVYFDSTAQAPADSPVALVVRNDGSDTSPGYAAYQLGSDRLTTSDGGQSWSHSSSYTMVHTLHGVLTRRGPAPVTQFERLTAVHVQLASEFEPEATLSTTAALRNRPPIASHAWSLDFSRHPHQVDFMADGAPDWTTNDASLEPDGSWTGSQSLETEADTGIQGIARVELRLRDTVADGNAAVFTIYADRISGDAAELRVELGRAGDGSQTLTFRNPGAAEPTLAVWDGLPPGYADVSLLIDPTHEIVHLAVKGHDAETFDYVRQGVSGSAPYAVLLGESDGAEFDFIRIETMP